MLYVGQKLDIRLVIVMIILTLTAPFEQNTFAQRKEFLLNFLSSFGYF